MNKLFLFFLFLNRRNNLINVFDEFVHALYILEQCFRLVNSLWENECFRSHLANEFTELLDKYILRSFHFNFSLIGYSFTF